MPVKAKSSNELGEPTNGTPTGLPPNSAPSQNPTTPAEGAEFRAKNRAMMQRVVKEFNEKVLADQEHLRRLGVIR